MKKRVFVVGFPKCGTSTIWSGLYRDPDVEMVVGEPQTKITEIENSLNELGDASYVGFKSAVLIYNKSNLRALVEKYPDAYIVVSVRHPINWFASFYDYRVKELTKYIETSEGWISRHLSVNKAKRIVDEADFDRLARTDESFFGFCRSWGRFDSYIDEFESYHHGDDGRLLYTSLEEIKNDPDGVTSKIYDFLGLDLTEERVTKFVRMNNQGNKKSIRSMSTETKAVLEHYYSPTLDFLNERSLL